MKQIYPRPHPSIGDVGTTKGICISWIIIIIIIMRIIIRISLHQNTLNPHSHYHYVIALLDSWILFGFALLRPLYMRTKLLLYFLKFFLLKY